MNYQATKNVFLSTALKVASKAFEGQYELKQYYTLGFYGQYKFDKRFSVFTDLQNVTDQKYFETRGFTTKGFNMNSGVHISL